MGSVWNEEVDRGLLEVLDDLIKHYDENDNLVSTPCFVRNPQEDFKIETFPSATIYNYDQKFDKNRFSWENIRGEIDDEGIMSLERPALPYTLFYQIEFWARYQEDINEITRRWVANIEPNTILKVTDTEGVVRHSVMNLVDVANVDYEKLDRKIFHRVYSYRIWVELDERNPLYERVVLSREIDRILKEENL